MRLFVLALLLVATPALAQQQRNQRAATAKDDDAAAPEVEEPFKILGEDPWIDAGIQGAAIFAAAAGSAAIAGGVLAFAVTAAGYTANFGGLDLGSIALLAVGGAAALALPAGAILLAATLTGARWIRGVPAAVLAPVFGAMGMVPGAIVGGIAGTAVFAVVAISDDDDFRIQGATTAAVVGAAVGAGTLGAIACMFGAGVGFAGGLTADYILNDGFPRYEGDQAE